jgi:hypothetical protein
MLILAWHPVACVVMQSLVTQPMMQQRSNATELRSMDSYIQILCRFQKSKRKVPPPSPLSTKKQKSGYECTPGRTQDF